MTATLLQQARSLPATERLQLIDELWTSLVDEERVPALTPGQEAELAARVAAYRAAPDDVVSWERIQSDLEAKHGWKP